MFKNGRIRKKGNRIGIEDVGYAKVFFAAFVLAFLGVFCFLSISRIIVGEIVVRKFGVENSFTKFALLDIEKSFYQGNDINEDKIAIEKDRTYKEMFWEKTYPFPDVSFVTINQENGEIVNEIADTEDIKNRIEKYVTDYLPSHDSFVYMYKEYESMIRWNLESYSTYNSVTKLSDGYLAQLGTQKDVDINIVAVSELADFCDGIGADFLFVKCPDKISRYWDPEISDIIDYSSKNAETFLEGLKKNGVKFIDFNEVIKENNWTRQQVFYRTDHHWRAETGFFAANYLLSYLKDYCDFDVDPSIIDEKNFDIKLYQDYFLGSQGKKVTLAQTQVDDFTLYYPKFETRLDCYIPEENIDEEGDMSLLYDMSCVDGIDYANKNPYATYCYGDQPLMIIKNKLIDNDTHILLIHDSFSDCVIPFLSLGCQRVDAIDLRHYTGSLETFIREEKPDIVIVAYHSCFHQIDWLTHKDILDFR